MPLPSGTVTLVFTDVEGSTHLLDALGTDDYAQVLGEHRRLIREVFAKHRGVEVDTQGDAFFFVFAEANDAVEAAAEAQRLLDLGRVRVRMGVHTGRPQLDDEGYVGRDVHLGARIAAAGHGGQVLLSRRTRDLVDSEVTGLGEHHVKDFADPVELFQLGSRQFPPLRTIAVTNLPRAVSTFVGRDRETREVVSLVREHRLVTLVGTGGSGKTRLAIESATSLVPEFANGVFWVDLSALQTPALVIDTVAQTLGAAAGDLVGHLADRQVLLVLDNFEQVVEAATEVVSLLESCPQLRVVVTSRQRLGVRGEHAYPVPPLTQAEGVLLFCARAGLEANADVEELCERLDRLPLALELAAARATVLSPKQILRRLSDRLDLLRGGRDADARQQTLRATIAWSYDLLTDEEKAAFASLAVFAGGCTLEAAEQVTRVDLDVLQSLVDKSLVTVADERFTMLDTVRRFALEHLESRPDAEAVRRRHVELFVEFAETARLELEGGAQPVWFRHVTMEQDNLRTVLARADEDDPGWAALRVAGALWRFWWMRGAIAEGRAWYARLLADASRAPALLRANALYGWAALDFAAGDNAQARQRFELALALYRKADDADGIIRTLNDLASTRWNQDSLDDAQRLYEEALLLARSSGNARGEAIVLGNLSHLHFTQGDLPIARELAETALAIDRRRGDDYCIATGHLHLALLDLHDARLDSAAGHLADSYALARALEDNLMLNALLISYAALAHARGDEAAAARLLGASAAMCDALGIAVDSTERALRERTESGARACLGDDDFASAFGHGRSLAPDQALALLTTGSSRDSRRT